MTLFADGEVAEPDTEKFATEIHCRKPAAEFIAKQIRSAKTEGRDVTPVLSALIEMPELRHLGDARGDPLGYWTRYFAREYLRCLRQRIEGVDMDEAELHRLENRPTLPEFYRRESGTSFAGQTAPS